MDKRCPKCNGLYGPPKYMCKYHGIWLQKKIEWLNYKCSNCGYVYQAKCKDFKP